MDPELGGRVPDLAAMPDDDGDHVRALLRRQREALAGADATDHAALATIAASRAGSTRASSVASSPSGIVARRTREKRPS